MAASRNSVDAKAPSYPTFVFVVEQVCLELALSSAKHTFRLAIRPVAGGEIRILMFTVNTIEQENTADATHLMLGTEA